MIVRKIKDDKEEKQFQAILTEDGRSLWKDSEMFVTFRRSLDLGCDEVVASIKGEFVKDFDVKLEAIEYMKWMDKNDRLL